jgi:hypothetical protein
MQVALEAKKAILGSNQSTKQYFKQKIAIFRQINRQII